MTKKGLTNVGVALKPCARCSALTYGRQEDGVPLCYTCEINKKGKG